MTYAMFIDDERFPSESLEKAYASLRIARSSGEAVAMMAMYGCPVFISFDHDLGGDDTAMAVVKWIVETDMDADFIPDEFKFHVHSQNPIGAQNIKNYLDRYLHYKWAQHD